MRTRTTPAPAWAKTLVKRISEEENISAPSLEWKVIRTRKESSGIAWVHHIRVVCGTDRTDARHTVIHEMAHVVMGQKRKGNTHHSPEFYATLYVIGKRHGLGARAIKARENWYKPRNVNAGYRLYLRQMREEGA